MQNLGITFSPRQINHLGLDLSTSFEQALSFGFSYIRLGVYWSEVEAAKGKFNFSAIDALLNKCEKVGQKVVLTIGVKAPRWPEFYWPKFVTDQDLNSEITQAYIYTFIEECVKHFHTFKCISYWQVENEPLDPSGPGQLTLPVTVLQEEVAIVRKLDPRPIMLTVWGNELLARQHAATLANIGDTIGIDVYEQQYAFSLLNTSVYKGPKDSYETMKNYLLALGKPFWVMELQSEPWEKDEAAYRSENPGSFSSEQLLRNIELAQTLGAEQIVLFGFEYLLYRASNGDTRYVELLASILHE